MTEIITAETKFGALLEKTMRVRETPQEEAFYVVANPHLWPFFMHPGDNQQFVWPIEKTGEPSALAWVYRGNWIARCPFCTSAQHVSVEDPWFFCADCKNTRAGNAAIPVVFPDSRDEIERILLRRDFVQTMNWLPGETTDDLAAENLEHLGHD